MKEFLSKIFIFSLIAIVLGGLLLFGFYEIVSYKTKDFRLNPDITEIFVGDSHIQCAIRDNLLINSQNFGKNSESYYYSYYKLNLLLRSNPNIRKVYLGFSYHSLSSFYDDFVTGKFSVSVSPKYFFILSEREQLKMLKINSKDLVQYIRAILKVGIRILLSNNHTPFSGSYENHFTNVKAAESSMDKRINFQYYKDGKLNGFSALNLHYFHKIINLCDDYNVDLIFLKTPLHAYYYGKLPDVYVEMYDKIIDNGRIPVIDLSRLKLTDNCFIPDGDHVSVEGASQTTREFIKLKLKEEAQ